MFTELKDYTLWYDGEISVRPSDLPTFFTKVKNTSVVHSTELTDDIIKYNKFVDPKSKITIKTECAPLTYDWKIPEQFKNQDLFEILIEKLDEEFASNHFTDKEKEKRLDRVAHEWQLFIKNNMIDTIKAIFFVINTFERENIVWGVGRGSSVSSYILYLLKVHDIDSIKYDLHIEDFIS